ncbi:MAG: PQQ-dependent sugar dehydrogenase [Bacteroidia bacterium]|nr:PQQ-dependent sugar dehydrogenase [Bacteroidia bacterium]
MSKTYYAGRRWVGKALGWGVMLLVALMPVRLQAQLPAGFQEQTYATGFTNAVGITFDALGRMFVWQKDGKVYLVENGLRTTQPLIDISEEVGNWRDFGLLGLALDPNFLTNGHIYLLYTVDRHHLMNYGTPAYNPAANDYYSATIGRVTRYTVTNPGAAIDVMSLNYGSRLVLLGETPQTGIPSLHESHGIGSLTFGADGTLLVTCGDGASYNQVDPGNLTETYYAQALADGIITSAENIGAYRVQKDFSLNGKVLRLDPATGNGVSSNPFYNAGAPRSPQSRLWGRGLRNPCRASLRPGTGSANPADANPGALYIGDVGWGTREEINVCDAANQNFGWPKYEGMTYQPGYNNAAHAPAVHTLAKIDWRGGNARFNIGGTPTDVNPGGYGPNFVGNCAIGGVWYTATDYPAEYQNAYFFADYGDQWIMYAKFNAANQPLSVQNFQPTPGAITGLGTHPLTGGIYYVNNGSTVYYIRYAGQGNQKPTAIAAASVYYGVSPLSVNFQGSLSTDPDGQALTYLWKFGDNTTSTLADPAKTFSGTGVTAFTVKLIVTDPNGNKDSTSLVISLNNTPPVIQSTSLDAVTTFSQVGNTVLPLSAVVTDAEGGPFTYGWQTVLVHDNHEHPEAVDTNPTTTSTLSPVGCNGELFYYKEILTVTDNGGLTATATRAIYPDCDGPTAVNDESEYTFGSAVVVNILSNDLTSPAAINPATVTITHAPAYGTAVINPTTGAITYTHGGQNSLDDYLLYTVQDIAGNTSGVAKVFLTRGGPRGIAVSDPINGEVLIQTQAVTVTYSAFGGLLGNEKVRLTLDGGTPVDLFFVNGTYTFTGLAYGNHTLVARLLDGSNTPLSNAEASQTIVFTNVQQIYPGNVKNNLALWLRADAGVSLNGGDAETWNDLSTSALHVTENVSTQRPTLVSNGLNFNPVLNFDGDDRMFRDNVAGSTLFVDRRTTIFAVQKATGLVTFSFAGGVANSKVTLEDCGTRFDFASQTINYDPNTNYCDIPHVVMARAYHTTGTGSSSFSRRREIEVDGADLIDQQIGTLQASTTATMEIGAHANNYFMNGDLAEVIVYKAALTTAQIDTVLTYLAIKYGISIDEASHLTYNYAAHDDDIAGIGRDALKMGLNQPKSRSVNADDIVIMSNPSDMQDGEYLAWGNNNGAMTLTSTDVPAGLGTNRLARVWRVQKTGNVGTVDVSFDLSTLGIPVFDASDVVLLVDTDGVFTNATQYPASVIDGNVATVSGVNFTSGNYFSVALRVACEPYCDNFAVVGNAAYNAYGCYTLTPDLAAQTGAAWMDSLVNLNEPFTFTFDVRLGANDAGADGIAFALQRAGNAAIGIGGGGLGIGGITPSVAVEIDSWQNDGTELAADHLSMFASGDFGQVLAAQVQALASSDNIEDGRSHRAVYQWDPALNVFRVYMDGVLRLTYTGDIRTYFPNEYAYFGFTGGTGGASNEQGFCVVDLQGDFVHPNDACLNCSQNGFVLVGNAADAGPSCLRLTSNAGNQVGAAWYQERINLAYDFTIDYTLYAGDQDAGADGTAFVLQNAGNNAIGAVGGGLGASGITPALGIEFDTYDNGDGSDLADDHISLFQNGDMNNQLVTKVCAVDGCGNIENNTDHAVQVDWDVTTQTLRVYVNGVLRTTYTGDVVNNIFGGNTLVYFGFTGATGGATNLQECCVQNISAVLESGSSFPIELLTFEAGPARDRVNLSWTTATETDNARFTVERSRSGEVFEAVVSLPGAGTTLEPRSYEATDLDPYYGYSYYRLRQTDVNGQSTLSEKVAVYLDPADLVFDVQIYPNPTATSTEVTLSYTTKDARKVQIEVYNAQGQVVYKTQDQGQAGLNTRQIPVSGLAAGVYHVRLSTGVRAVVTRMVVQP